MAACSSGEKELDELCRKDAGSVIYKQVEADGFYYESCTDNCWHDMMASGFSFIEMNNQKDRHRYLPEKGFWHIYISNDNDPNCNKKMTDNYNSDGLKSNQCFAVSKIKKPTARYAHVMDTNIIELDNYNKSIITRYIYQIKDRKNNEVLAETITYRLDANSKIPLSGGLISCKEKKKETRNLFRDVFILSDNNGELK